MSDKDEATRLADALRRCADIDFDGDFGAAAALLERWPDGEPAAMSPEFTDTARNALKWVLWHHQGARSKVGQAMRFALGMGKYDRMTDLQIAQAKQWDKPAPGLAHEFAAPPDQSERIAALEAARDQWHGYCNDALQSCKRLEAALEQARVALRDGINTINHFGGAVECILPLDAALRAIEEVRRG